MSVTESIEIPEFCRNNSINQRQLADMFKLSPAAITRILKDGRQVKVVTRLDGAIELVESKILATTRPNKTN